MALIKLKVNKKWLTRGGPAVNGCRDVPTDKQDGKDYLLFKPKDRHISLALRKKGKVCHSSRTGFCEACVEETYSYHFF